MVAHRGRELEPLQPVLHAEEEVHGTRAVE